jgi:hypothetical protein
VIATVTLTPAVVRTLVVPGFTLGRTNRISTLADLVERGSDEEEPPRHE